MSRSFAFVAIALAAILGASTTASARPRDLPQRVVNVVTVNTSGIDVRTVAGARVVAARILSGANRACGGAQTPMLYGSEYRRCRNAAVDAALASLNAPLVTAALGRPSAQTAVASR